MPLLNAPADGVRSSENSENIEKIQCSFKSEKTKPHSHPIGTSKVYRVTQGDVVRYKKKVGSKECLLPENIEKTKWQSQKEVAIAEIARAFNSEQFPQTSLDEDGHTIVTVGYKHFISLNRQITNSENRDQVAMQFGESGGGAVAAIFFLLMNNDSHAGNVGFDADIAVGIDFGECFYPIFSQKDPEQTVWDMVSRIRLRDNKNTEMVLPHLSRIGRKVRLSESYEITDAILCALPYPSIDETHPSQTQTAVPTAQDKTYLGYRPNNGFDGCFDFRLMNKSIVKGILQSDPLVRKDLLLQFLLMIIIFESGFIEKILDQGLYAEDLKKTILQTLSLRINHLKITLFNPENKIHQQIKDLISQQSLFEKLAGHIGFYNKTALPNQKIDLRKCIKLSGELASQLKLNKKQENQQVILKKALIDLLHLYNVQLPQEYNLKAEIAEQLYKLIRKFVLQNKWIFLASGYDFFIKIKQAIVENYLEKDFLAMLEVKFLQQERRLQNALEANQEQAQDFFEHNYKTSDFSADFLKKIASLFIESVVVNGQEVEFSRDIKSFMQGMRATRFVDYLRERPQLMQERYHQQLHMIFRTFIALPMEIKNHPHVILEYQFQFLKNGFFIEEENWHKFLMIYQKTRDDDIWAFMANDRYIMLFADFFLVACQVKNTSYLIRVFQQLLVQLKKNSNFQHASNMFENAKELVKFIAHIDNQDDSIKKTRFLDYVISDFEYLTRRIKTQKILFFIYELEDDDDFADIGKIVRDYNQSLNSCVRIDMATSGYESCDWEKIFTYVKNTGFNDKEKIKVIFRNIGIGRFLNLSLLWDSRKTSSFNFFLKCVIDWCSTRNENMSTSCEKDLSRLQELMRKSFDDDVMLEVQRYILKYLQIVMSEDPEKFKQFLWLIEHHQGEVKENDLDNYFIRVYANPNCNKKLSSWICELILTLFSNRKNDNDLENDRLIKFLSEIDQYLDPLTYDLMLHFFNHCHDENISAAGLVAGQVLGVISSCIQNLSEDNKIILLSFIRSNIDKIMELKLDEGFNQLQVLLEYLADFDFISDEAQLSLYLELLIAGFKEKLQIYPQNVMRIFYNFLVELKTKNIETFDFINNDAGIKFLAQVLWETREMNPIWIPAILSAATHFYGQVAEQERLEKLPDFVIGVNKLSHIKDYRLNSKNSVFMKFTTAQMLTVMPAALFRLTYKNELTAMSTDHEMLADNLLSMTDNIFIYMDQNENEKAQQGLALCQRGIAKFSKLTFVDPIINNTPTISEFPALKNNSTFFGNLRQTFFGDAIESITDSEVLAHKIVRELTSIGLRN